MKLIPYLHDFISELPKRVKEEISRLSTQRHLARDEAVYRQGDPSNEIFHPPVAGPGFGGFLQYRGLVRSAARVL